MKMVLMASLALSVAGFSHRGAMAQAAQTAQTAKDGIYSADQAQQGQTLYGTQCASCHGPDLGGAGPMPALAGDAFLGAWGSQTVDDLFDKIQTTMPATQPGSLTPEQTAQVVAYILSANKFPAGSTSLPSDPASLKKIQIGKPAAAAAPGQNP